MSLLHRIAGGAIVVQADRILLVRYSNGDGSTYLAAPGGGALEHETVAEAAVRETLEETGVHVVPRRVLLIEDIVATQFKCCKIWLACDVLGGTAAVTEGARREGIIEVRWYRRAELTPETVYPWIVQARDWSTFRNPGGAAELSPSRRATL